MNTLLFRQVSMRDFVAVLPDAVPEHIIPVDSGQWAVGSGQLFALL